MKSSRKRPYAPLSREALETEAVDALAWCLRRGMSVRDSVGLATMRVSLLTMHGRFPAGGLDDAARKGLAVIGGIFAPVVLVRLGFARAAEGGAVVTDSHGLAAWADDAEH